MLKKFISLFLVIFILTTMVGCGGSGVVPGTNSDQESESEEMIYLKDVNPDSDLLYLAGKEDGEKVMSLGSKDSQGNILNMDGAVFINDLGEGLAIEVDGNGYPTRMVDSDGNKLTFTNYTSSTVDINIYDFDENLIAGPITVDLDPDLLAELLQLYKTTKDFPGLMRDGHDTAKYLKAASVALKLAGCAASAIGAAGTGGIAIPLAVIACGSAVASLIEAVEPDILPITPVNSAATGVITNGLSLIFNDKFSPWGVGGWLFGTASNMIEFAATKVDIDEIHTQFIQALENQNWEAAWRCCILNSEAYNMVLGAEIAFEKAGLNPNNTTVDISFTDTSGWFVERPIAYVHHDDVIITLTTEGNSPLKYSGEWLYTEFQEKYENKWRLTKSGILNLLELGSQSDDSEETIDGDIYKIDSVDNFELDKWYGCDVYVKNIRNVAHTFTVRGVESIGSIAIEFKEEEKSISLDAGQSGYVSFEYKCMGDTEDRFLIFRLYENADDEPLDIIDQMTKIIQYSSGTTLSAPTGVDACDGWFHSAIYISWNPVSGASHYKVFRSDSLTGIKTVLFDGWFFDDNCGVYDTNLPLNTTHYFYWVKAATSSSGDNESPYSTPDEGWAYGGTTLPAPTGVTASDGTYTDRVYISWNSVTGANCYKVYRATSETGTKMAITSWQTSCFYNDFTATSGTHYFYWVKAAASSIGDDESPYSAPDEGWSIDEEEDIFPAPTLYPIQLEGYQEFSYPETKRFMYFTLSWSNVVGADVYNIEWAIDSSNPSNFDTHNPNHDDSWPNLLSETIAREMDSSSHIFYWRVRAESFPSGKIGYWSNIRNIYCPSIDEVFGTGD